MILYYINLILQQHLHLSLTQHHHRPSKFKSTHVDVDVELPHLHRPHLHRPDFLRRHHHHEPEYKTSDYKLEVDLPHRDRIHHGTAIDIAEARYRSNNNNNSPKYEYRTTVEEAPILQRPQYDSKTIVEEVLVKEPKYKSSIAKMGYYGDSCTYNAVSILLMADPTQPRTSPQ